jgi:DNA-directed RNA polymerase specialized sigma24 family protein
MDDSILRKSDWVLTQSSFRELLTWLDEGKDSGGRAYLDMRLRLVQYFDRKNCVSPDELADETLNRVARRLAEEGSIISDAPAQYCYIVARYVFLESLRQKSTYASLPNALPAPPDLSDEKKEIEKRSAALEKCLRTLDPDERALITDYYQGQQRTKIENRKRLAANLKLTTNALGIRACRIRDKLEACVRKSLQGTK